MKPPKNRSPLRKWLGKRFYIGKRYVQWLQRYTTFAQKRSEETFPYEVITHRSLLLRQLKSVDMYLQHQKVTNLTLAIQRINGIIIEPNQTFSFWFLVGNPSKRKGYLEGLVLDNGSIKKGVGGGLCQLGNLIFWMTLHTPLTVTERWRHSYDVFPDSNRTQPFGSGATLSYNYVDLQIKNTTNTPFQLKLWLDKTHLNGRFYTTQPLDFQYEIEERNHFFRQEYWGGYTRHNQLFRKIFTKTDHSFLSEELILENHALLMYRPFLENKID